MYIIIPFQHGLRDLTESLQFLLSGFTLILKSLVQKHEMLSRGNAEIFRSMQIESKSVKVVKIKYENTNRRTSIKGTFKQLPGDTIF